MQGSVTITGMDVVAGNMRALRKAVEDGMFADSVEAAAIMVVNEARSPTRPLAWNDVTGNLRSSIYYQVEQGRGPVPQRAKDGSGALYNNIRYDSGNSRKGGVWGVVFASPDYAISVEAKSSRSVLIVPLATVRRGLHKAMGKAGKANLQKFMFGRAAQGLIK